MVEQLNIFGGFVSIGLALAVAAGIFAFLAHILLQPLHVERFLWQPILLDLTLFLFFWWGLSLLADWFLPSLIAR
ncbi:MAG: hypothetical protein KGQ26_05325 [Rhodospirillales bacterium]|nr:hypothetical protein [Rhodospirillales bacterium]MDE2319935.1 hypothetical protein [Rhodospirillales bacterium]